MAKKRSHSAFCQISRKLYLRFFCTPHIKAGYILKMSIQPTRHTAQRPRSPTACRCPLSSIEDFGVLWVWGFRGDSHRDFFSVGMGWVWGLKSNPHGSLDGYPTQWTQLIVLQPSPTRLNPRLKLAVLTHPNPTTDTTIYFALYFAPPCINTYIHVTSWSRSNNVFHDEYVNVKVNSKPNTV